MSTVNCQLTTTREREFTGSGLYGFMNGGADLFMEYEVEKLTNRDVVFKGESYTIDIYEMPTAEDAFGIYSMQVFRCQEADQGGGINCLSPYQWLAVKGNNYVSIVFPSGSEEARRHAGELMNIYLAEAAEKLPAFPETWKEDLPYSGNIKYVRGPITTSNVSKDLSQRVKGLSYKGIWFRKGEEDDTYEACILMDPDQQQEAEKRFDASTIHDRGVGCLYIKGKEKEEEATDFGPFGF
ncbi:hypothetical protein LJC44_02880 [Parabacteroides sp. OttesenSCG-928-G06]|nr:hypothetical protein [Parabacteroides sp. OttesenSCG-928-G06]